MTRHLNQIASGVWQCFGCREVFDKKSDLDGYHCHACLEKYDWKERALSDQRAIANTCRSVTAALAQAKRDKEPAALPEVINSLVKGLGGPEQLGNLLRNDFDRLHGVGLSPDDFAKHEFKEGTIQRYWQMLLRGLAARDEQVATVDLQGFTDEELKAVLIPLAAEMLVEDGEFRASIIREAVLRDPQIIEEIVKERGQVVDAGVVPPVASKPMSAPVKPSKRSTQDVGLVDTDVDPAEIEDHSAD